MKIIKQIMIIFIASILVLSTGTVAFAGDPDAPSTYSIFHPLEEDDRYKVTSTVKPYLSICKLILSDKDGNTMGGTGFLISPTKIVTAAHCLDYYYNDGETKEDWKATSITVLFGASGSNSNYTSKYSIKLNCTSKNTIVPENWKRNNSNYDYGLIILPKKVETGYYFNLYPEEEPDNVSASIVGYENCKYYTKFTNYQLIRGDGTINSSDSYKLRTRIGGMPGQSGSPVLDANNRVIGIFTYGSNNGDIIDGELTSDDWNKATRITQSVIDFYEQY